MRRFSSIAFLAGVLVIVSSCGPVAPGGLGQGFGPAASGLTCASGQSWQGGNSESELMNPGYACRSCHSGKNFQNQNPGGQAQPDKAYFFMGTVYSESHESDLCAAADVPSDAVVEILDTNDVVQLTMTVNAAGNFRSRTTNTTVPMPYRARVKAGGKINAMGSAQTDGDCNTCHTAAGLGGAPGRVMFPK